MAKKLNEGVFGYKQDAINTLKIETLLEDENFSLYLIDGKKYDDFGVGVSYNNEYRIKTKDPMKKCHVTLCVDYDPDYNEYRIPVLIGPTKTSGNFIKVASIKDLVEGLQKANTFRIQALKVIKDRIKK